MGNEGFNDSVGSPLGDVGVCPFCHSALSGDTRPCVRCGARQHSECFDLAGGCSILGCAPAEGSSSTESEHRLPAAPEFVAAQPKRNRTLFVLAFLCVALPLIAIFGTRSNWFEPLTGKIQVGGGSDFSDGFDAGYDAGDSGSESDFSDGYDSGWDDGYDDGYDSGYDDGYYDG